MYPRRGQPHRSREAPGRLYTYSDVENEVFAPPNPRKPTNDIDAVNRMEAGLLTPSDLSDTKSSFELVSETDSGSESEVERGRRHGLATHKGRKPSHYSRHQPHGSTHRHSSRGSAVSFPTSEEEGIVSPSPEEDDYSQETDDFRRRSTSLFDKICFEKSLTRNLGFEPNVISPPNTEFMKLLLYEFSIQHISRVNQCIPMPVFILTSLVDPVIKTTSTGERELTRSIVTHAVLVNYYYQAKVKIRSMQHSLTATIQGATLRNIAAYVTNLTPAGRAAALALHFLTHEKLVYEPQYQVCLRRLHDELRKRRTSESPCTGEIYECIRDYNLIFLSAPYTTRGALYTYRNNLQKLTNGYKSDLKLLCSEKLNEEHFLNDLAFLTGIQIMMMQFRRNLDILRLYLCHQLQNLSNLIYLIYLQFPSLRSDYLQVTEAIYRATNSSDDEPLFQVNTWLFDFLRAVRSLDVFVCPDYILCALRQWTVGTDNESRLADIMLRDAALQDPRTKHGNVHSKCLTRNVCIMRLHSRPTSRHTSVEHVMVPIPTIRKLYQDNISADERESDSRRQSALRTFLELNGNHPASRFS
ncbi:tegument protein UL25 [Mandrillus leucophaeus cytomegalovirus]|uniref:Tegument protein UL25 n=1 Tax=Mandrillus leucophaeus cytomegalovirus TaxID=1654930 RepID=A0A0G2UGS0_9BETA|nr:tegument protein UL25 [Mandrillus leucophaeus cytomegalovirus]AKI29793.1 tegument protein UL25 [Mandrillus leucophaeus cytomegalovirus]